MLPRNIPAVLFMLAASAVVSYGGQNVGAFYNVDKEVRVEGRVEAVAFEPRYKDNARFLMVRVVADRTGEEYRVEVGPDWFFSRDIHQGEKVRVVGSLVADAGGGTVLIARELRFRGETVTVRDARGFPMWRGGLKRGPRR